MFDVGLLVETVIPEARPPASLSIVERRPNFSFIVSQPYLHAR